MIQVYKRLKDCEFNSIDDALSKGNEFATLSFENFVTDLRMGDFVTGIATIKEIGRAHV